MCSSDNQISDFMTNFSPQLVMLVKCLPVLNTAKIIVIRILIIMIEQKNSIIADYLFSLGLVETAILLLFSKGINSTF